MRNFILRRWVLTAASALALGASAAGQGTSPIFTKNAALRLPVQLDERARIDVAQVKLYVRTPAGRWECAHTGPPTQTAFDYKALTDGEYWFTFVTVDQRGTASPANVEAYAPHRKVIVDATAPDVAVQAIPFNGEKALQCQVRDAHPDWTTLRVVYQAPDRTWQPLAVAAPETPTVFRIPNASVLESKVQVTVMDRAGNRTTREIDLGDPTVPLGLPAKAALDRGKPDPALFPRDERTEPVIRIPATDKRVASDDLPKAPKLDLPDVPDLPDIRRLKNDVKPEIKLPPEMPDLKIPEPPNLKIPDPPSMRIPATDDQYKIPDLPGGPTEMPAIRPPIDVPQPPVVPVKGTAHKPADTGVGDIAPPSAMKKEESPTKPAQASGLPVLNTRTCTVNYTMDGPVRVSSRIDFWASSDGGRTWIPIKNGSGVGPPARLTLPDDGVWGIRIRPGGGSKPPEALEDPDCVVEIDTIKPAVQLAPPTVVADEGMMVIAWTAADKNLLGNSINLYYAGSAVGPWKEIVSGYKNEGVYRWALPTTLAEPVYLRVEASDRAGNIGRYDLPTPVALESGKQRVKVIGIGPGQ